MTDTFNANLVAHRGLTEVAVENSRRAIDAAWKAGNGVSGVEFDVQLTADKVPILFHDAELDRVTDGSGYIADYTYAALPCLKVSGEPIPRLEDVLSDFTPGREGTPWHLNVEIKMNREPEVIISACTPLLEPFVSDPAFELTVSSFDPRFILGAAQAQVPWRLAYLYEAPWTLSMLKYLPEGGAVVDLHPRHDLITAEHLKEYAAPGRVFRAWTVDDVDEAERLVNLGVTTLITNEPVKLAKALRR
jgi:glycerophosphoryl diester phosphodiesterase